MRRRVSCAELPLVPLPMAGEARAEWFTRPLLIPSHKAANGRPCRHMERAVFDRMAELDQHHWWFLARRRILETLIDRIVQLPKKARILEVGCGTGHNLSMLKRFG